MTVGRASTSARAGERSELLCSRRSITVWRSRVTTKSTRKQISTPPTGFQLSGSDEQFSKVTESQRTYCLELVDKLENDTELTELDRMFIAAVMRSHAQSIPDKARKPKGRPQKYPAGEVALLYAMYRMNPEWTEEQALARVAREFGAPEDTVRSIVRNHREAIISFRRWGDK